MRRTKVKESPERKTMQNSVMGLLSSLENKIEIDLIERCSEQNNCEI